MKSRINTVYAKQISADVYQWQNADSYFFAIFDVEFKWPRYA